MSTQGRPASAGNIAAVVGLTLAVVIGIVLVAMAGRDEAPQRAETRAPTATQPAAAPAGDDSDYYTYYSGIDEAGSTAPADRTIQRPELGTTYDKNQPPVRLPAPAAGEVVTCGTTGCWQVNGFVAEVTDGVACDAGTWGAVGSSGRQTRYACQ